MTSGFGFGVFACETEGATGGFVGHELSEGIVFAGYARGVGQDAGVGVVWVQEVHWFDGFVVAGVFVEPAGWGEFVFVGAGVECHNRRESLVKEVVFGDCKGVSLRDEMEGWGDTGEGLRDWFGLYGWDFDGAAGFYD